MLKLLSFIVKDDYISRLLQPYRVTQYILRPCMCCIFFSIVFKFQNASSLRVISIFTLPTGPSYKCNYPTGQKKRVSLKVHKRENFLGFDFEICTFS
jgi:hypothetical protein